MKKNKPFRLLVEGINDLHVVCNLANRLSLLETFEVEDIGSYQQILKVLPVLLKSTNNLQRLYETNLIYRWRIMPEVHSLVE